MKLAVETMHGESLPQLARQSDKNTLLIKVVQSTAFGLPPQPHLQIAGNSAVLPKVA